VAKRQRRPRRLQRRASPDDVPVDRLRDLRAGVQIGGITPDGKTLYAIYFQNGGDVGWGLEAISTATNQATDSVWLATLGPGGMVFTR